jgi:hypothetical protein
MIELRGEALVNYRKKRFFIVIVYGLSVANVILD